MEGDVPTKTIVEILADPSSARGQLFLHKPEISDAVGAASTSSSSAAADGVSHATGDQASAGVTQGAGSVDASNVNTSNVDSSNISDGTQQPAQQQPSTTGGQQPGAPAAAPASAPAAAPTKSVLATIIVFTDGTIDARHAPTS